MIRLTSIELKNFKNVGRGRISLSSAGPDPEEWDADIVGIYGQNGSGKTSAITALYVLKAIWALGKLPDFCEDCMMVGQRSFTVSVEAVAHFESGEFPDCRFTYSVEAGHADDEFSVLSERLTYKMLSDGRSSARTAFEYRMSDAGASFRPYVAWDALCAMGKGLSIEAAVARRLASSDGRPLLMTDAFRRLLEQMRTAYFLKSESGKASKKGRDAYADVLLPTIALRNELREFATQHLSIVTPSRQAEPMLNVLRISTHEGTEGESADAYFMVNLSNSSFVLDDNIRDLQATISTISTVIGTLVPGLRVEVKSLGKAMNDDGNAGERIEIVATRGDTTVPLRAESEGIKKLVAILILLVNVYSKPESCVAVDELDSGVFEFLLGEILQVLQDHGRGQLIFTAHNLRPLETLDKTALVFTTTNPGNRYVTFKGVKAASNLRDQYLRAINLGGQPETVYQATSKYEIDSAFYDAANPMN